jgi:hypothetical protein
MDGNSGLYCDHEPKVDLKSWAWAPGVLQRLLQPKINIHRWRRKERSDWWWRWSNFGAFYSVSFLNLNFLEAEIVESVTKYGSEAESRSWLES